MFAPFGDSLSYGWLLRLSGDSLSGLIGDFDLWIRA